MNFGRAAPKIASGTLRTFLFPRKPDASPGLRLGRTYAVQSAPGSPAIAEVRVTSLRSLNSNDITDSTASQFVSRTLALEHLGPDALLYLATLRLEDEPAPSGRPAHR